MLSGIGPGSLLLILLIVVVLFGTKKLRNIGGDLGGAIKSFRKAAKDDDADSLEQNGGNEVQQDVIQGESSKHKD